MNDVAASSRASACDRSSRRCGSRAVARVWAALPERVQLRLAALARAAGDGGDGDRDLRGRQHARDRPVVDEREDGAEDLVTGDELAERALERGDVERPLEREGVADVGARVGVVSL